MTVNRQLCEEIRKRNKWSPDLCMLCRNRNKCKDQPRKKED